MKVFFSYSHFDEAVKSQLIVHLAMLKRTREIEVWHDRMILGGEEFDESIRFELEHADLIILLVSPHFLNSDYCYSVEMDRAIERARANEAHILPVIAETCDWKHSPISIFKALPLDGKPLSKYANVNDGLHEVVNEVRRIIKSKSTTNEPDKELSPARADGLVVAPLVRSSNLQIQRVFTAADRDQFLFETFEFVTKFFEGSLEELKKRNPDIQTTFRSIDKNKFTCQIYRQGTSVSKCQITLQTMHSRTFSIYYCHDFRDNAYQESLSVKDNGQIMYLAGTMGKVMGKSPDNLSKEGAAEYLWSILIEPLQR